MDYRGRRLPSRAFGNGRDPKVPPLPKQSQVGAVLQFPARVPAEVKNGSSSRFARPRREVLRGLSGLNLPMVTFLSLRHLGHLVFTVAGTALSVGAIEMKTTDRAARGADKEGE